MKEKSEITKLIESNKGRLVALLAAGITGGIAQLVTSAGLSLPADVAILISSLAATLAGWAVDRVAARSANLNISEMQDKLAGVTTTGRIGTGTQAAVERLVAKDQWTAEDGELSGGPLTSSEAREAKRVMIRMSRDSPALAREVRSLIRLYGLQQSRNPYNRET